MTRRSPIRLMLSATALPLIMAACASAPQPSAPQPSAPQPSPQLSVAHGAVAARAADIAARMVGRPYRYGGASPRKGFDCSGLVQYSFGKAGLRLPHNTAEQRVISRSIPVASLRRGDLVFFDESGQKSSHVGIYLGHERFVHAPSFGEPVRVDRLDSRYWRKHLSEARRL